MKILTSRRDNIRNRVFHLRISKNEDEDLRKEAEVQGKSMGELVRRGYLSNVELVDL